MECRRTLYIPVDMKKHIIIFFAFSLVLILIGCFGREKNIERIGRHMVDRYEKNTRDLSVQYNEALWKVIKDGTKEDYDELVKVGMEQMTKGPGNASREQAALEFYGKKLDLVFEDLQGLETVRTILESGRINDPVLERELQMLYLHLLNRQSNTMGRQELMNKDLLIMQDFPPYRPVFRGDTVDEQELYAILYRSSSGLELKEAWQSLMGFGEMASEEIIKSVKVKNQIAKELGFSDYYVLEMAFYEEDTILIEKVLDEFEQVSREPYVRVKDRVDEQIAQQYGIDREQIRPWHYQSKFFSRLPISENPALFYSIYDSCRLVPTLCEFYAGIGLPVDDIVQRSEMEKENSGLNISFMMNIDFRNDIRVVIGETGSKNRDLRLMFHEFGHALHNKYTGAEVPYLLRLPNLALTEAVSVLFERRFCDRGVLSDIMLVDSSQVERFMQECRPVDEMNHLIYERFIYLMAIFERELFRDPDQDLNALWYSLMDRIMMISCPERTSNPDWAASRHVFLSHAMIHNYLLADIIATQLLHKLENEFPGELSIYEYGLTGHVEAGTWLKENVLRYGNSLSWSQIIKDATGEELSCRYYLDQYAHLPN